MDNNDTMVAFAQTGIKCDDNVSKELRAKIRNDSVAGPKLNSKKQREPRSSESASAPVAAKQAPRKRPIFLDDPSESNHDDTHRFNSMAAAPSRQDSNASFENLLPFRSNNEYNNNSNDPSTSACSSDSANESSHHHKSRKSKRYGNTNRLRLPRSIRLPKFNGLLERVRNAWADLDCRQPNGQGGGSGDNAHSRRFMTDMDDSNH
ncbi:hypothetical protein MPSEU_000181200 [Mayamaea pseudoterrestris]|nr:hypothetical protein MPSEU_000181200 [Mayamaea pseudoterrestris]